jgi:transposase
MGRGDLSDEEWGLVGPLLPSERGRWARPAGDNRRFRNGMLHVLRIGWPWRDMNERYGKWNSVYVRFRRWAEQGVWDALLQTLVDQDQRHSRCTTRHSCGQWPGVHLEGAGSLGLRERGDARLLAPGQADGQRLC